MLNVGGSSVERARQVMRNAVPEVIAAVDAGHLRMGAAEKLSALSPDEQRRELANPSPSRRMPPSATSAAPRPTSDADRQLAALARVEKALDEFCAGVKAGRRVPGVPALLGVWFAHQQKRLNDVVRELTA